MENAGRWDWSDAIQLLIEHGHSFQEVKGYTLRQLRSFTEAAERAQRRHLVDQAHNLRAANLEPDPFKAYIKTLTDG